MNEPIDFYEWLKKNHPKWVKKSKKEDLKRILITPDGLGCKIKERALNMLLGDPDE